MLERADTTAIEHTMHGGTMPMHLQWYFRADTVLPVAVQRWVLPPGGSEGMHRHPPGEDALEELYVLCSGVAVMRVDDVVHELRPGDAVLAPAGSRHDIRNTGTEPVTVLVVWGPPGTPLDWSGYASGRASAAARNDRTE